MRQPIIDAGEGFGQYFGNGSPYDPSYYGMKDVGSTSFGLVIAYLLPGFAGLFAISFWSPPIHELFAAFIDAQSNVGRFLLVILSSLVVGLEVGVIRWLIFEKIICHRYQRDRSKYSELGKESKLSAFRAAVDEYLRYHQFWGGMTVVTPVIAWGIISSTTQCSGKIALGICFLILETLNVFAGRSAFCNYIESTNRILSS